MKVKVVSDGTPKGTRIYDCTGALIRLPIDAVDWHVDTSGEAVLRLTVAACAVEVHADLVAVIEGKKD